MEKEKIHITVTEDYITSYGNLSVKFNKGDKMPYFEIKYKEEGTENYVNIYTGNDIFKGWIMTYYKLLQERWSDLYVKY